MNHPPKHCLISQSACGREPGNPVCPKCGMDERVVYPGKVDLETALEKAELRYWKAQAQELQQNLQAEEMAASQWRAIATEQKPAHASPSPQPEPPTPPTRVPGQVFRDTPWAPDMVVLPSGSFMMGSPADEAGRSDREGPQHRVTLAYKLAIGKYPVTFDEWDACVADGGTSHKPKDEGWGRGKRPVINVSWNDAQAYVAWLNKMLGIGTCDPSRYRLPSEAEWEYACRAGSTSVYWWGNAFQNDRCVGNTSTLSSIWAMIQNSGTKPVDSLGDKSANPWGLQHMHGNVWEWVQDVWHDNYASAPTDGSAWTTGGDSSRRVKRGGPWLYGPGSLRSAYRVSDAPDFRDFNSGFRLARTVP